MASERDLYLRKLMVELGTNEKWMMKYEDEIDELKKSLRFLKDRNVIIRKELRKNSDEHFKTKE